MALSETIYFAIMFALSVIFTVFSMVMDDAKVLLKIIAGLCWIFLGLLVWVVDPAGALTFPFSLFFWSLGFVFWLSTFKDYYSEKKGEFARGLE